MNLLVDVANIDDFQHLARPEDGRSKVEKAQAAVAALKAVVAPYETSLKRQEQARAEIAARRVTSAESRASAQRLDELRATFVRISSLEPRKRGYALEELLRDLFDAFELDPKASFKVVGEQIDGGFTLDTQHYIVEAKWEAGPADRADLDVLAAKVERRADNTLGLFVAYAGFKPTAIELHSARRSTLMLVDGADLYAVLEGRIDLRELLRRKRLHDRCDHVQCCGGAQHDLTLRSPRSRWHGTRGSLRAEIPSFRLCCGLFTCSRCPRCRGFRPSGNSTPYPPCSYDRQTATGSSEPRVDRFALECEHREDALVHPMQRLATDKALEGLNAQAELADGERALLAEPAAS